MATRTSSTTRPGPAPLPGSDDLGVVLALQLCRLAVAFVWFYHGLVPKLLGPAADELLMDRALGLSEGAAVQLAYVAGVSEIVFAAIVLVFREQEWPLWLTIAAMSGLLAFAAGASPLLLIAAFNPVSTNVCVAALAAVALLLQRSLRRPGMLVDERTLPVAGPKNNTP